MLYNDFKGLKLSALGMGTMRVPTKTSYNDIDEEETYRLVKYALVSFLILAVFDFGALLQE